MAKRPKDKAPKQVEALRHTGDKRVNIPTAEHQSVLSADEAARREVRYPRNTDLDPQLVWRGKDYQDWSDLVVQAPPLYIQEKVHPMKGTCRRSTTLNDTFCMSPAPGQGTHYG